MMADFKSWFQTKKARYTNKRIKYCKTLAPNSYLTAVATNYEFELGIRKMKNLQSAKRVQRDNASAFQFQKYRFKKNRRNKMLANLLPDRQGISSRLIKSSQVNNFIITVL